MRRARRHWAVDLAIPYASERELCDVLSASARRAGLRAYPETGGWDLLLVREDGLQVGVQAKLRETVELLEQATREDRSGPDVRAVAVPLASTPLDRVARRFGLGVIGVAFLDPDRQTGDRDPAPLRVDRMPFWSPAPTSRVWLPPVVPMLPAGVPNPRTLSPWKVAAARVCRLIRERGDAGITRAELIAAGGDPRRWINRWIELIPDSEPRRYRQMKMSTWLKPDDEVPVPLPDEKFRDLAAQLALAAERGVPGA